MTISEADASPRLRSLWRERAPLQRKLDSLDEDFKETAEQLRKVDAEIASEEQHLSQKNGGG